MIMFVAVVQAKNHDVNQITNWFRYASHWALLISALSLIGAYFGYKKGQFDLMVKKLDLLNPIYDSITLRTETNYLELLKIINVFKRTSPTHHDNYVSTFYLISSHYRIAIDPKIPIKLQKLLKSIDSQFENCLESINLFAQKFKSSLVDDSQYQQWEISIERDRENLRETLNLLNRAIIDDLSYLSGGVKKRRWDWFHARGNRAESR